MKKSLKFRLFFVTATLLCMLSPVMKCEAQKRPLDLVFCLDLSGSTNGLINDVRDNLWLIINQANNMKPAPDLRIGVIGFSRPSFGKNNAYVKVLCDLTYNFDHLSAELYKLKPSIEKGDQIVSAALLTSVTQMSWSKDANAFKVVFLCGNGMVTANGYEYVKSCEEAAERNIVVNTLYIPSSANMFKELPAWRRISSITHGIQSELTVCVKDSITVFPDAKFDNLTPLNDKLNVSYLWSGRDSSGCRKHQATADSGAFYTMKDIYYNRLYYKTTNAYASSIKDCDLINAYTIAAGANAEANTESSTGNDFANQLQTQKAQRNKLIESIKSELPENYIEKYRRKFDNGGMIENNIFQRVVLNILFKQWGS